MSYKSVLKLFAGTFLLVTASSCKKYLEKTPADTVPETDVFSSVAGMGSAITGAYNAFNGAYANDIYATSLMTDEAMLPTENNTGRGVIAYRWQFDASTGEVTAAWAAYYSGINRANKILDNAVSVPAADNTEAALKEQYRGEAIAMRAWGHFQLLKHYSAFYDPNSLAVPYMEKSEITKPSRLTVSQVVSKVKTDLASAKAALPASFVQRTRITRSAVTAMQAQVALYEKNWDDAITYASDLISIFPLATPAQFLQIWRDQTNTEVIWKLKRNPGEARMGDSYFDRTQSKIIYAPSKELRDLYNIANDIRYTAYILDLGGGRFTLNKYRGGDAANLNLVDLKVLRVAEMYLIRSEAYAEKNDLVRAAADLNSLRAARITGYVPEVFATKQAILDALVIERFKELAFEGDRYFDLKRRKLPITRIPEDAINALGAVNLTPDKREYLWPIMLAEIQANENIQQNPGF